MKIGFMIDPLNTLKPYKDSSVALMQSTKNLGHDCFYFTQFDVFCTEGNAYSEISSIEILDINATNWAKTKSIGVNPLTFFDIIIMRKDPPFSLEYVYATYALELAQIHGVLVANTAQSLRDANEKFYIMHFPQLISPTIVSNNIKKLKEFWDLHKKIVLKPLENMGGKSVFLVNESGNNLSVILDTLTDDGTKTIMAQVYIPEITQAGDKRILLINGEPCEYALQRMPKEGEFRANLAAGASGLAVKISERDRFICNELKPHLQEKGIYFAGIDVIGDYVSEINITSPTCLREIHEQTSVNIANEYINFLVNKKSMPDNVDG